ncbi:MAG: DUF1385 domain-containing protein [Oscillospiraceae bacterium]
MEKEKPVFKTRVGGQALMEGIMMRGADKMCVAVREPSGNIFTEVSPVKVNAWHNIFFVRGVLNMADNLISGYKCLMKSADIAMQGEEVEEDKFDKWIAEHFGEKGSNFVMALAALFGGMLAIVLFMILPTTIVGLVDRFLPLGGFKTPIEGVLKLVMLVGYMWAVSFIPEMKRLFSYHGAEHKTIACYEAGEELTVENVRRHRRFHPRCGTSFILIVIVISILLFSVLPWTSTFWRVIQKLLLLPLVIGISYEIIKICGRYDNIVTRAISAPGLWLQHITTQEPDDSMIEVAIAAVLPVLPENKEDAIW